MNEREREREKINWFRKAIPAKNSPRSYAGKIAVQGDRVFITDAFSLLYTKNYVGLDNGVYDNAWGKTGITAPSIAGVIPDEHDMREMSTEAATAVRLLCSALGKTPKKDIYLFLDNTPSIGAGLLGRHTSDEYPIINPWLLSVPLAVYFGRSKISGAGGLKVWVNKAFCLVEFATKERLLICGL